MIDILIVVEGGVVQSIISSAENVRVIIKDYDVNGDEQFVDHDEKPFYGCVTLAEVNIPEIFTTLDIINGDTE